MKMYNSGNSSNAEPQQFSSLIPTLERLALQEMSLVLYKNEIHPCSDYDTRIFGDCDWSIDLYFDPKDVIDGLPSVISKMIKQCTKELAITSIPNWCHYHNLHVFFDGCLHEGVANCIDEFVLKPDGRINFRSTAKNIIMGEKLNLVEKYRLACLYCLVDDVRHIWPMVQDNPRVIELNPVHYPIIHYWNCVMKGESRRFPGTDPDSLEECLVILNEMRWESIEYFWNVLSADEQITAAKKLLVIDAKKMDMSFIEPLLKRLDETQLRRIMREIPFGEMLFKRYLTYFKTSECPEIFNIWIHIKQYISPLEFLKIICIFIDSFKCESEFGTLLFEVWSSASDKLRDSFLNNFEGVKTVFQRLPFTTNIEEYSDMRFFVDVLKLTRLDFQSKKKLWFECWPKLIIYTSPKYLDPIMKACFCKEDEIIQFKQYYMINFDEITDFCNHCIDVGNISKLNDFLNFSASDIHHVTAVKQQIIRSPIMQRRFGFNSFKGRLQKTVDDLGKFIDSASFNDEEATYHKKNYISFHWLIRRDE